MNVEAYIAYHLFNVDGAGMQPYHQVAQAGMHFEGGMYGLRTRYLGYITGDSDLVEGVIDALGAWKVMQLTASEAIAWSDEALPVNTRNSESGEYFGPAGLDGEGRIVRPTQVTPW